MAKITQEQLAVRWHMSPRTLEQWRWLGKGPRFLKIGARVLYDEDEVEAQPVRLVWDTILKHLGYEHIKEYKDERWGLARKPL